MSKFDDSTANDLTEEQLLESLVEEGPSPSIAPAIGSPAEVLQKYSHCNFCGGRLHFVHSSDFSRNTTHEKASCPECGLEARQVLHRLQ